MLRNVTLLLLACACGGKTVDPLDDGGTNDAAANKDAITIDVGPPTDAFPPTDGAPQTQCNTIDPGTKMVSIDQVPQDPPPFASSSTAFIQPGLYELTAATLYTGPNGQSGSAGMIASELRANIANSADYIFQVASLQGNQAPMWTNASANNAGPGALSISTTCPTQDPPVKALFTADAQSFTIRVSSGNATADETFDLIGK